MSEVVPLSSVRARKAASTRAPHLLQEIRNRVVQAIADFPEMLVDGDRVMVCVSGGKDSYALADVLVELARRAPIRFELVAVNIDQGWPGYDTDRIARHLATLGIETHMITRDYAQLVEERLSPGQTPCSLCSRFRRGVLYNLAEELGCQKIALGHHMDDCIETLVMNMFYSGRLSSMPAVLRSDDGRNTVIRPMVYVSEEVLTSYAAARRFPVVRCGCPSCGLPEQKRQQVKRMLADLESREPGIKSQMLAALRHVVPSHLLDRRLSPFGAKDCRG